MADWPHAPAHRTLQPGTYIITGSTYRKAHHFATRERLNWLTSELLNRLQSFGWHVQTWSLFSNHYHVIASNLIEPENLSEAFRQIHSCASNYVNGLDGAEGRKVMYQYWDTLLTFEKSSLARLNYVLSNPVKHRLVEVAENYPWCSAAWMQDAAPRSFFETVRRFKTDKVKVMDDFDPIFEPEAP